MTLGALIKSYIQSRIIKFINIVSLAHQDYPYHDYHKFTAGDEPVAYNVGTDNREAHGDQTKLFVSKDTLLLSDGAAQVRFNNAENVLIDLVANQMYSFEGNIHTLFVETIAATKVLYAYFEGVLPEEARSPL